MSNGCSTAAVRTPAWVVVNTHASQEQAALENLARQDFVAYCPAVLKRRSHARRVLEVRRPLFPGYLFVNLDPECDHWRPILSTVGVRSLVRFGQRFGAVHDGFIASLRESEQNGVIAHPSLEFRIGQKVRLAGSFDGIVATILALDEKDRLTVLMDMMQRPIKAKVRAADVTLV